jgi:hypothetical protein
MIIIISVIVVIAAMIVVVTGMGKLWYQPEPIDNDLETQTNKALIPRSPRAQFLESASTNRFRNDLRAAFYGEREMMIDVLRPLLCIWQAKWAERPPKVMKRSQR